MKRKFLHQLMSMLFIFCLIISSFVQVNGNDQNQIVTKQIADGVEMRYFATVGGKKLEEGEEVREGQVIKYEVTIINHSGKDLNNVNLTAQYTNAVFYGKEKKATYTNKIDENTGGRALEDLDYYVLTDKNQESYIADNIKNDTSYTFKYEIQAKKNDNTNSDIKGQVTLKADAIENKNVDLITNKLKEGEISIYTTSLQNVEFQYEVGRPNYRYVYLKNISDKDIENEQVIVPSINNLKISEVSNVASTIEDKKEIPYIVENDNLVINIDSLKTGEEKGIEICFDIQEQAKNINLVAYIQINDYKYYSNEYYQEINYYKSDFTVKQINKTKGKELKKGDVITVKVDITNNSEQEDVCNISTNSLKGLNIKRVKRKVNNNVETLDLNSDYLVFMNETEIKGKEKVEYEIEAEIVETDNIEINFLISGTNNTYITDMLTYDIVKDESEHKKVNYNIVIAIIVIIIISILLILIKVLIVRKGKKHE